MVILFTGLSEASVETSERAKAVAIKRKDRQFAFSNVFAVISKSSLHNFEDFYLAAEKSILNTAYSF